MKTALVLHCLIFWGTQEPVLTPQEQSVFSQCDKAFPDATQCATAADAVNKLPPSASWNYARAGCDSK